MKFIYSITYNPQAPARKKRTRNKPIPRKMTEERDLFLDEDLILDYMDVQGRLDVERELNRLVNVMFDVLIRYSNMNHDQVEPVYNRLKQELQKEYFKTRVSNLNSRQMRVWHTSLFSSIVYLQKLLVNKGYDEPGEIVTEFEEIVNGYFSDQLEQLSEQNDIENVGNHLVEPQYVSDDDMNLFYWVTRHTLQSGTYRDVERTRWQTNEPDMDQTVTQQVPISSD